MNRSQIFIFTGLLTFIMLSMLLSGCSYKTYTGEIGDATYSFKYRGEYPVNPPNPLASSQINANILSLDYFISVTTHPGDNIETVLGSYKTKTDPQDLNKFEILGNDTINIAGIPAEHITYIYEGYTTLPVLYGGNFAYFKYKSYTVEIHVLFPIWIEGKDLGTEAFNMLVETFKIED
jgi:hypothetical protein